jgi:Ni/Fe-hydrogenase subunit HybB-like protein
MRSLSVERCAVAFGRPVSQLAAIGAARGVLAFGLGVLGRPVTAFAALDASFLFFAGLAAGGVALAAAVRVAYGRWARPLLPVAEASSGFFGPALGVLLVLLLGARTFIPSSAGSGMGGFVALLLRQLILSSVLFAAGRRFVARVHDGQADEGRVRAAGVLYLLCYAVVLSFWAFDLVMRLSDTPPSTVVPAYYFLGAFLSGLAWIALMTAIRRNSEPDLRHDVGKLLFAFIVLWSYLLWALFLPTWYANIPEESTALLRRWHGAYKPIAIGVLIAVAAWPFWLLFSERFKRRRTTLAIGAATILIGLLAERFLLVFPSLELPGGVASWFVGAGVVVGVAGLFLLSVGSRLASLEAGAG